MSEMNAAVAMISEMDLALMISEIKVALLIPEIKLGAHIDVHIGSHNEMHVGVHTDIKALKLESTDLNSIPTA